MTVKLGKLSKTTRASLKPITLPPDATAAIVLSVSLLLFY